MRLIELLLEHHPRFSPCVQIQPPVVPSYASMDSEVLTSLPMDDISQHIDDHAVGDILLGECMPQISSLLSANGCMSYEPNLTLSISEAGTSLAEMLQTESILLAAETQRRNRTESTSSTSSALQQLLTSDSITVPILGNSSSIVAKSHLSDAHATKISTSTVSSHGRPKLAQALMQSSPQDNALEMKLGITARNENVTLAQILQTPNESQSRVADAISQFAALPEEILQITDALDIEAGYSLSIGPNTNLDIESFPLFNGDDGLSLFENGIAATDVGSLLEQFEEAASNLMADGNIQMDEDTAESSLLLGQSSAVETPSASLPQPTYPSASLPPPTLGTPSASLPPPTLGTPSASLPPPTLGAPSASLPPPTLGTPSASLPQPTLGTPSASLPPPTLGTPSASLPPPTLGTPSASLPQPTLGTPSASLPPPKLGSPSVTSPPPKLENQSVKLPPPKLGTASVNSPATALGTPSASLAPPKLGTPRASFPSAKPGPPRSSFPSSKPGTLRSSFPSAKPGPPRASLAPPKPGAPSASLPQKLGTPSASLPRPKAVIPVANFPPSRPLAADQPGSVKSAVPNHSSKCDSSPPVSSVAKSLPSARHLPAQRRPSLVNPESEVVKLLKAKRRIPNPNQPSPAPTSPATPPPEIIEKIKASNKRKSAIMLADAVPARGNRGGKAVSLPDFSPKPKKPDSLKAALANPTKIELSPFKLEEALLKYSQSETTSACNSSGENSRSNSPALGGTPRKKLKISISQYKNRMMSRESSRESSPQRSLSMLKHSDLRIVAPPPPQPLKLSPSKAAAPSATVTNASTSAEISANYFKLIADHDYCQNVLVSEELKLKQKSSSRGQGPAPKNACITDMEVLAAGSENRPVKTDETSTKDGKTRKSKNSVLKSLLLNSNLAEELKVQAEKDRVFSMHNMNGKNKNTKDSLALVAMDVEDGEREEERERFDKFASERNDMNCNEVENGKAGKMSSSTSHNHRQYRSKRSPSPEQRDNGALFDKLPDYCTALSVPNQPGAKKLSHTADKLMDRSMPYRDRDPSPDRSDPMFDKLPAYHNCFTNSTRYDRGYKKDPLGLDADLEQALGHTNSAQSSRSQTPSLVIASRMTSRTASRAASPVSRPTSRSRSRSFSRSRSQSRSRSRSPIRRSRRRRSRRLSTRSKRRRSYSSSSSSSDDRSGKGYHSSSSSSGSRSRSRSRRSRRRNRSRSHSHSRSSSWIRWKEQQRIKREDEKKQKIEERRIIYVGRIPNDFTRRDLRHKFGRFGDIEEASVHLREHGDNYGFVTFSYTCDAYAAIERGNGISGCEKLDLCFGGRREFCKSDYADLDGNMENDEEMGPVMPKKAAPMDFDEMLRQATLKLKKKS